MGHKLLGLCGNGSQNPSVLVMSRQSQHSCVMGKYPLLLGLCYPKRAGIGHWFWPCSPWRTLKLAPHAPTSDKPGTCISLDGAEMALLKLCGKFWSAVRTEHWLQWSLQPSASPRPANHSQASTETLLFRGRPQRLSRILSSLLQPLQMMHFVLWFCTWATETLSCWRQRGLCREEAPLSASTASPPMAPLPSFPTTNWKGADNTIHNASRTGWLNVDNNTTNSYFSF